MGAGYSASKVKQLGNQFFKEAKYSKAARFYSEAIRVDKANYQTLCNRCLCYLKLKKYAFAYADAIAVVKLKPDFPKGHYRLALVFLELNMLYEARRALRRANALEPASPQIKSKLAETEEKIEKGYRIQGRPSLMIWGTNKQIALGVKNKASQLMRPTSVASLAGISLTESACGVTHVLALDRDGEVYTWGQNQYGQCGVAGDVPHPVLIPSLVSRKITAIACGGVHSIAIQQGGIALAWGLNSFGQCGMEPSGQGKFITTPTVIDTLRGKIVRAVAAGLAHSMFLADQSGDVYTCGWNQHGQLGLGKSVANTSQITKLANFSHILHIACGGGHTLFVTTHKPREVYATGSNTCGQLGLSHKDDVFQPARIKQAPQDVVYAACGEQFSVIVTEEHRVFSFGLNNVGQLGVPATKEGSKELEYSTSPQEVKCAELNIEDICCSKAQTLGVGSLGKVHYWGLKPLSIDREELISAPAHLTTFTNKVSQITNGRDFFNIVLTGSDPERTYATGALLNSQAKAGARTKCTVRAIDRNGQFLQNGGDRVCVVIGNLETGEALTSQILPGQEEEKSTSRIDVTDLMSGSYEVAAKLTKVGQYQTHIFLHGVELALSPYLLTITPGGAFRGVVFFTCYTPRGTSAFFHMNAGETVYLTCKMCDKWDNPTAREQLQLDKLSLLLNGEKIAYSQKPSLSSDRDAALVAQITKAGKHELSVLYGDEELEIAVDYEEEIGVSDREMRSSLPLSVAAGYAHYSKCALQKVNFSEESKENPLRAGEEYQFLVKQFDQFGNATLLRNEEIVVIIDDHIKWSSAGLQGSAGHVSFTEEDFHVRVKFVLESKGTHTLDTYLGEGKIRSFNVSVINGPPDFLHSVVRPLQGGEIKTGKSATGLIEMELYDRFGNACVSPLKSGEIEIEYYHFHQKRKATDHKQNALAHHPLKQKEGALYSTEYVVSKIGTWIFEINIGGIPALNSPCQVRYERDKAELAAEKKRQEEERIRAEQKRKKLEEERMRIEAEKKKLELEERLKEQERLKKVQEREKKEREKRSKEEEEQKRRELEKAKRAAALIKRMEELEEERKKAQEETMKRLQQKIEREKKMKRCGGGFVVPFKEEGDEAARVQVQNLMKQ